MQNNKNIFYHFQPIVDMWAAIDPHEPTETKENMFKKG